MDIPSPHIVIISAVYPPEPVVSARLALDLATFLIERDIDVTVLCPQPSRPNNTDYSCYLDNTKPLVRNENGIEIVRLPSYFAPQSRIFPRMRESYSFGRYVCKYLEGMHRRIDAIYVNSWPIMGQALIAHYVHNNNLPMVLQIMDIYPESMLNKLSYFSSLFLFPLMKLDGWISHQAKYVSVISDNMRDIYIRKRKVSPDAVVTIRLWQDETLFRSFPSGYTAFKKYGIPSNCFNFLYLGNIGPVAGVDFLIRAYKDISIPDTQLLIVGDGSTKDYCKTLVARLKVKNVYFISDPNVENVPLLQSMADVFLLPLKRGAGMSSIPSKLPAYMFSAKPVLATTDAESDTAKTIRMAGCGWVGGAEDLQWLTEMMKEVASMSRQELQQKGDNGLKFGLANFSKKRGVGRLGQLVLSAITSDPNSP